MDHARQTRDSYDQIAARFLERNRDRSVLLSYMQRFRQALPATAHVIDLGAGPCHDSAALRGFGLSVISVDYSRSMLAVARQEFPGLAGLHRVLVPSGVLEVDSALQSAGFGTAEASLREGSHDRWIVRLARPAR